MLDNTQASVDDILLDVKDLRVSFRTDEGLITPVDGVSFQVKKGKTLGIVGESGSGKSVSTRALMRLMPKNGIIDPQSEMTLTRKTGEKIDISRMVDGSRDMRALRGGEISMIFQEPMASFSPVYSIGNQISEAIRLHRTDDGNQKLKRKHSRELAIEMLERVGMSNAPLRVNQYPHELSGGMRQRAMIAVALSTHPSILIADEPTTALDVTIQAQILSLMKDLQTELGMSIIFITHDMGVIAQVADEVAVMYLGKVVERGPTRDIIRNPQHPYTKGLLDAIPSLSNLNGRLKPVPGDIPSPLERPVGCVFSTRCQDCIMGKCELRVPGETLVGPDHYVSCFKNG